mgnify:FL=1
MAIKLELDLNELNGVLGALGQMPFAQVEPLVNKIRQQAIPQAQAEQEAANAAAAAEAVAE